MNIDPKVKSYFNATRQPLEDASTLAAYCYTSPEWYAEEMKEIFFKEWICVGRCEKVANKGDYFTMEIGGEPIVVTRDHTGKINAFSNVCRHRGALVAQGSGNARTLSCPYHAWTYKMSGELIVTPGRPDPMIGCRNFDRKDHGLVPIRIDTWGGFLFINFSETTPDLHTWLGDLPEFLKNYRLQDMVLDHQLIYDMDVNWKVFLENSMESYHISFVHQKYFPANSPPQNWQFQKTHGPYEAMYSTSSILDFGKLPSVEGLSEKERSGLYHIWIPPNFQLIVSSTYMSSRQYIPVASEKFRIIYNWCFQPETRAVEGFRAGADKYYEFSTAVLEEDVVYVPQVQKGLNARLARPGRYSPQEFVLHKIGQYVIERVCGDKPFPEAVRTAAE